jgi:hypothetical protein
MPRRQDVCDTYGAPIVENTGGIYAERPGATTMDRE